MRLAFIGNASNILFHRWVNFFAGRGHEVTVLDGFGFGRSPALDDRIRFVAYDARGRWRLPLLPTLHARRELRRILRDVRPDVLHAHSVKRYGWQAGIAGWHPYVVSTWGSDVLLPPEGPQARLWNWVTLSRAAVVTAVSEVMREAAIRRGARPDRVERVHFGVDTNRFTPATVDRASLRTLGVDERPYVFSPRAVRPLYNHETVAAAFATLEADVQLVVSGRNADPTTLQTIRDILEAGGALERLRIVADASDDEMLALFRAADVVVSVPLSDSFPITLLEAMACGTPIVAGDLPAVRAGLIDLVPEWIVPTTDVVRVANAISRGLQLPADDRRLLATRLRERALESDQTAHMLRMEDLYRGLIRSA
jgi:glycosyltransferase involved in cell wall biosynthesis